MYNAQIKKEKCQVEDITDEAMAILLTASLQGSLTTKQNYRELYRDCLEVFLINKARLRQEREAHLPPIKW